MPHYRLLRLGRAAIVLAILTSRGEAGLQGEKKPEQERANDEKTSDGDDTAAFFRIGIQPAHVIQSTDFVRGNNLAGEPVTWGTAVRAELGWQVPGSKEWHHLYRFPSYGIGLYLADFGSDELGTPVGAYGFFSWPFAGLSPRAELTTDIGFGATFGWNSFDPESNPFNRAIASSTTFYIDWGLLFRYYLTDRIDVYAGASFTHFSNGGTRAPNQGLNTVGPLAGIQYRFADRKTRPERRPPPELDSHWGLVLWGAGGSKNIELPGDSQSEGADRRQSFGVANLGTTLLFPLHPMSTLRGGVDLTRDGSANAPADPSTSDELALGLYGGYQQEIAKFSILVDVGYHVWRGRDDDLVPAAYQRIGWSYRFFRRWFAGIQVRFVDFRRADFIEWTVGYRVDFGRQPPSP